MSGLRLGDRLAPLVGSFGFLEAPLDRLVEPFAEIVADRVEKPVSSLRRQTGSGPLDEALAALLPLRSGTPTGDRYLLAPTASDWVAYFENAWPGDPRVAAWKLPDALGCRSLVIYAAHTDPDDPSSALSTVGFALRAPGRAGIFDAVRIMVVSGDDPTVRTYGDPLPFEDTDPQQLGLDLEWLDRYCQALGVRIFDADFYLPPGTSGVLLDGG